MYRFPAFIKVWMLAEAREAPGTPPQFSDPHSPVANARVTVERLEGIAWVKGTRLPVTLLLMVFVFQFMVMLVSL